MNDQCKIPGKKSIIKTCILKSTKIIQCKETAEHGVLTHKPLFLRLCRKVSGGGKLNGRFGPFKHVGTTDFCGSCFEKEETGTATEISS